MIKAVERPNWPVFLGEKNQLYHHQDFQRFLVKWSNERGFARICLCKFDVMSPKCAFKRGTNLYNLQNWSIFLGQAQWVYVYNDVYIYRYQVIDIEEVCLIKRNLKLITLINNM